MAKTDYYDDPTAPAPNSLVVAVAVMVLDDYGQVLLIQRSDNGLWALPGGGQELGETVRQAGVRETYEETGLEVEVTGIVGIYSDPRHVIAYDDGEVRQEYSVCLRARATGGELATSDESRRVCWIDPGEVDQLSMHPSMRRRVQHGLANQAPYLD
ncbi:NUDIX hydrolase [Actinomycetospora callitridis]|uniref:NUDIX hydrolase n=1 Tax=Actinomycetospora callitridis TaxID=913944 RepID=UPI0023669066|nr:NUDIX domain-containing protein [Actinomycetospora callitridis]MDD7920983.1 NUDIX domain-containing protein [Actinomycetospora callitridis]